MLELTETINYQSECLQIVAKRVLTQTNRIISPTAFFVIKQTRCTDFTNLFWHEILHVSDNFLSIIRNLFTVHSAMVYVIQVCRQLSTRTRMEYPE